MAMIGEHRFEAKDAPEKVVLEFTAEGDRATSVTVTVSGQGPLPLLAGWWVGQALELGLAGAVLGAAANGVPLRRIWAMVTIAVVACVAVTIVLQSLGLAPAMKAV
ncbi:MAG: hypothetical protein ACE5HV_16975 [Acidobacteriota bacterium]